MSDILSVREKLKAFGIMGADFMRLIQTQPEGWQRDYIVLRRTLQESIAELGATGRRVLAERGDAAKLREFEDLHVHYRRLVSLHHADWPVVNIQPGHPDYLRSVDELFAAYLPFAKALREIFG